jgi:hypothetical protein
MTAVSVALETELSDILMNLVSFLVINDISKWFGSLYEKYLKLFYSEITTSSPKYLQIKIRHIDEVASYIYCIVFILGTASWWIPFIFTFVDICNNRELYSSYVEQEGNFGIMFALNTGNKASMIIQNMINVIVNIFIAFPFYNLRFFKYIAIKFFPSKIQEVKIKKNTT